MLADGHVIKKAPLVGAFFIVWSFFFTQCLARDCQIGLLDEQVHVRAIIDGDTLLLKDGRKVRLTGINTPELDHEHSRHEPRAVEARQYLQGLITKAEIIGLHYGVQRYDRYHRLLANVIVDGLVDVQQKLLLQGLAFSIAIPPNLFNQACYHQAESVARENNLGVWGQSNYQPRDVDYGRPVRGGFQLIQGHINKVHKTPGLILLELAGGVTLRVRKKEDQYFDSPNSWLSWQGRYIEARGWLYRHQKQWRMNIRHRQNIVLIQADSGLRATN